ncbi:hypothetical protein FHW79_005932 [Azospirillum sp. OGB3]|uniref:PqiC family protein n=1 Tax=Azospirillum sp. OGB3 TaxID=2587012 RepID=UPI001606DD52|nr:PqiC family protein [Azospirillum sp. OGB3]MBB3268257.1 hypothetical protein [Azospirillum sp. OGB3]
MRSSVIRRRRVLSGLMAVAAMAGCSSTPARLYVLTPMAGEDRDTKRRTGRSVGVQLVSVPEYLDRPEIIAYTSAHELSANRDDRWAERLPVNATRVLVENLSILLGTDRVYAVPSRTNGPPDYEVSVEFDRFERTASDDSVLDAHWAIHDGATQKVLVREETRLATRVVDNGYPALVAAMNDNLTALSRDIAKAIAKLPNKGGSRART